MLIWLGHEAREVHLGTSPLLVECMLTTDSLCALFSFVQDEKGWSGYEEIKVEDTRYFHGNVKKVFNNPYVMVCLRCDKDLD